MSEFRVKVDSGKYEFIQRGGWKLDILRGGKPWCQDVDASKAIYSMMAELDAARVVLQALREHVAARGDLTPPELRDVLEHHSRLVDDHEPPSSWSRPAAAPAESTP